MTDQPIGLEAIKRAHARSEKMHTVIGPPGVNSPHDHRGQLIAEVERLRARIAELERDAARYRWLRNDESSFAVMIPRHHGHIAFGGEALDSKIDAAMSEATKLPPAPSTDLCDYGYAPGNYMSTCLTCNEQLRDVDKRCRTCRPCAEKRRDKAMSEGESKE